MSHKGRYVHVDAGATLPKEIVEQLLSSTAINCCGFCAPTEKDGEKILDGDCIFTKPTVEEIMAVLSDWKDSELYLHFGQYPKEFAEACVQPLSLIEDAEGIPLVSILLDGDFKYAFSGKEDTTLSTEYMIVEKILRPVMAKFFKAAKKDVAALFEDLTTDPSIPPLIKSLYKTRGSVTFIGNGGEKLTVGTNALRGEFTGWWTSNKEGLEVEVPEVEIVTRPQRRGFGRRVLDEPTSIPEGMPPERETETAPLDAAAAASNVQTAVHSENPSEGVWMAPPSTWSKNQKKKWYEDNNDGAVPDNYKTCPKVLIKAVKTLAEIGAAIEGKGPSRPIANTEPIHGPNVDKQVSAEIIPVAPPSEKKWLHDVFFKLGTVQKVISDALQIVDPKKVKAYESKFTSYIEMAKLDSLNRTLNFSYEDRLKMCTEAPHIAAILMQDLSFALAEERELVRDPIPEEKAPDAAPGDKTRAAKAAKAGEKVPEPELEAPPVTKRRGFGQRNVA